MVTENLILPGTLGYSWCAPLAGIGCGEEEGSRALISLTPVTRAGLGPVTIASGDELVLVLPGLLLSADVVSLG